MSKINHTLYQMLATIKNRSSHATIERKGTQGAVIVRVSILNKYEDWLIREFPQTQSAQAYMRAVGRIEKGERIEEKNWYRPADEELAFDFDAGASVFLDLHFLSTRISESE